MLMPADEFLPEMAEIWAEEIPTAEMAQIYVLYLMASLRDAAEMAFEWIATDHRMKQLCGFLCLARLLQNGAELNERSVTELRNQAQSLLPAADLHLKKAIHATLTRLEEIP